MNYNTEQRRAIEFTDGACSVIATAGSGKTEVLTRRIESLVKNHGVSPDEILAVTFSNKAAIEMEARVNRYLPDSGVKISTFHSFGNSIVQKFGKKYDLLNYDYKKTNLLIDACRGKILDVEECASRYLDYIAMQKHHLQFPKNDPQNEMELAYELYEDKKKDENVMDFDDMLTKAYKILKSNRKALKYYQEKYRYILADEMQDTNTAEYEIIKLIAGERKNVFIVSDPLQNIYEWLGSDNRFVLEFDKDWDDATIINLATNYRSTVNIVDHANRFAGGMDETNSHFYVEAHANQKEFKDVDYKIYANEYSEANEIVKKIKELKECYDYRDIGIIARTNSQLMVYESIFSSYGIPYIIHGSIPFVDREEIKTIICYLKLIDNQNDISAFKYIMNRPSRYLPQKLLLSAEARIKKTGCDLFDALRYCCTPLQIGKINDLHNLLVYEKENDEENVGDMIRKIRMYFDLDSYFQRKETTSDGQSNSKVDNLETLCSIAEEFNNIYEFLESLGAVKKSKNNDAVNLMTIHKSKGLEFPVVFLIGVNEGILPHAKNPRLSEEKRLFYVAITRPEKELYISSTLSFRGKDATVSRFVDPKGGLKNGVENE